MTLDETEICLLQHLVQFMTKKCMLNVCLSYFTPNTKTDITHKNMTQIYIISSFTK